LLAKLVEEQGAGAFLGRGGVWVEDAHGVDFHVGLAHLGADLALGIAGAVVAAVGDDEEGLALVAGVFHLGHAVVYGVQQGGAVSAANGGEAGLDVLGGTGEVLDQLGAVVEPDDKELVLGIGRFDELQDGFLGPDQLGGHGAGKIEDDANGDGCVFGGEGFDPLLAVILKDFEIFLLEAGDEAVHGVRNGD